MANKIANGLELSKQSWNALRQNKQLIAFPVISMIGITIATLLFLLPESVLVVPILAAREAGGTASNTQWILLLVVLFLYYLVTYIVIIFSNTALVGATLKMINGESATVGDGISIALSRFRRIFVYALISATVGVIARGISQSGRGSDNFLVSILAMLVGGLIQGAWNLLVFLALPVMIVEDLSVRDSLKRSMAIFKETWGEGFVGSTAVGGISCLAYLAIFLVTGGIIAAGILIENVPLVIVGAVFLLLGFVLVALLNGAVNGIFQASLYQYATTGNAGPFIDSALAEEAFK